MDFRAIQKAKKRIIHFRCALLHFSKYTVNQNLFWQTGPACIISKGSRKTVETAVERVRYVHRLFSVPQLFRRQRIHLEKSSSSAMNEAILQIPGFVCGKNCIIYAVFIHKQFPTCYNIFKPSHRLPKRTIKLIFVIYFVLVAFKIMNLPTKILQNAGEQ